jgi:hypothetical protein
MASLGEDLLHVVNKLQDLVFNTIGNDSLDLPQIVRTPLEYPLLNLQANAHCRLSLDLNRPESPQSSKTSSAETFYREEAASSLGDPLFSSS